MRQRLFNPVYYFRTKELQIEVRTRRLLVLCECIRNSYKYCQYHELKKKGFRGLESHKNDQM